MKKLNLSGASWGLLLIFAVYLLSACGGGGGGAVNPNPNPPNPQLTVGQITGPDSVVENQTGAYSISASGVSGISYTWTLTPSSAGTLQNASSSSASLTAAEVTANVTATLQVVVSGSGVSSVTRTKSITIVDVVVGDAPEIHSVSPTTGSPGQSATFVANVDGTTPFTYSWNFGGGATPNTSTQASPAVTLAGAGTYSGSLTVTNSVGQDVFNFTIAIASATSPPVLSEVRMSALYAGDLCEFGVFGTGTEPMTFLWNFGGGASPNTSSEAVPVVALAGAGSYNGSVTATNSAGSDTLLFGFTVYVYVPNIFELLDGSAVIIAQDGTYLGLISSNEFLSDSIMNQFGTYGSQFSPTSIFNEFGTYGSQFSYLSPWNEFASSPPMIFVGDIFVAYLTVNSFKTPAIDPFDLINYLAAH